MHLNEVADPKTYALPADNMAAILEQLERILEDDNAHNRSRRKQPYDKPRKLMDEWQREGIKRQSRRQHLLPRRSQ